MGVFDFITKSFVSAQTYNELQKKVSIYEKTQKPQEQQTMSGTVYPIYQYTNQDIYSLSELADILVIIKRALRSELTRNGFEVLEAEKTDANVTDVDEEQSAVLDEDRQRVLNFVTKCNNNNESLRTVVQRLEDDINTIDQQFALFVYQYKMQGNELYKDLLELYRIHPNVMSLIVNDKEEFGRDDAGNYLFFDCRKRNNIIVIKPQSMPSEGYPTASDGFTLFPAWYKAKFANELFYAPWEIFYNTRYNKSRLTGFSPVVSVWNKVRSLLYQDQYILELYQGKRPPKGMLVFSGINPETLQKAWQDMTDRSQTNPNLPAILGLPSNLNGSGKQAEFFDFMRTLEELSFTDQRNEFRQVVGAVYGVSPVFQNDVSVSGGLNNEGLQITVTNRVVEDNQAFYNESLLNKITTELNAVGWSLRLRPSEEQDEMARLERQEQSLRNGEVAVRNGLQVEYDDTQGECIIKSGILVYTPVESPIPSFETPASGGFTGSPDDV
jgi:hypothetical protein